jgi:23S rRNA (cytidine2498-2'-O)-methyltransferase
VDPAFARQVYPRAQERRGAGPNDLAAAILDALDPAVALAAAELDVTTPELARRGSNALEEHPLTAAAAELADALRKKVDGRRAKHGGPPPSGHVLHVLLVDTWRAWASAHLRQEGPRLLAWPARFPGGRALDELAKDAPSSAHRKLEEALLWLEAGPGPGDAVLDLGAAPGGWSWVALQRGARVVAVDRADLDEHVARHERLTHARADAFAYVPERQPTWLLCDVITEPQRSLDLARKALGSTALRGLVVTLKLKKPVDLEVVAKARATAMRTPGWFGRCKQLASNKLEVTLMMRRA